MTKSAAKTDATATGTAAESEATEPDKAAIAKALGGTIRVLRSDKDGKRRAIDRRLTGDDILSVRAYPDKIVAVCVDGQRREMAV